MGTAPLLSVPRAVWHPPWPDSPSRAGGSGQGVPLWRSGPCSSLLLSSPQGSKVLVDARDKLGIPWQHSENEKHGMFLMAFENKAGLPVEPATFQLYVPALSALWGDSGIREAFSRRSEFQLVSGPAGGGGRVPRGR